MFSDTGIQISYHLCFTQTHSLGLNAKSYPTYDRQIDVDNFKEISSMCNSNIWIDLTLQCKRTSIVWDDCIFIHDH